ncbi:MAG: methionyl-tRNA formyltransferase [Bacillota bacterium]|uniref:Methionyl-tRNA formyltransferase n=1 Tax=Thermanaerosceptrum fracticalcis TaxID=1712410 RepID=A0A7G6E1N9_THEFR|nr:methionyl-tRNA formyltransferase [Thermanaerosceptrum fracticalcis]QNB45993.1 methionyl-tRNA formyltransferase [Thermanaerosceptrum fracticalcis]
MRIVFMGTPEFAVPSLKALYEAGHEIIAVITQPDRPRGRGQKLSLPPVKEAALALGLNIYQPHKIREQGFVEILEDLSPDLIVVVAFGQILPPNILSMPPYGCINVHASLLPAYRGPAPIHWAIMNGEKVTGITTMLMDTGLDTGDMLLKEEVPISPDMTTGELHDLLAQVGAGLLVKTIELWQDKKISPISQNGLAFSYAPLLKREHELIQWEKTAETIFNQIRGLEPWPGAYTMHKGSILKIRGAQIYHQTEQKAQPGTVLKIVKDRGFVVQTGEGSILVTKVQPFGKQTMAATSFCNGYHLEVGYVFGTS